MTNEQKLDNEEVTNIIPFARPAKTGGFNPDDPIWINNLGVGTIFLARKKGSQDFVLGEFAIYAKTERAVIVFINGMGDQKHPIDPIRFCNQYELFEVLRTAEQFMAELEANDSNRTLQSGGLADDETPESVDQEDEEEGQETVLDSDREGD